MIRDRRVLHRAPLALLAVALPFSGCNCDEAIGALPVPRAVLVDPTNPAETTPPLEIIEIAAGAPTALGSSAALTFTVRNDGERDLEVDDVAFGSHASCPAPTGGFAFTDPADAPRAFTVEKGGGTRDVTVTFTPATGAPACAVVEVFSNDPASPVLRAVLRAQGDAAQLCTDRAIVDFGEVYVGDAANDTVTLASCGTRPITLRSASLNAQFPDPFTASTIAANTTLNPGDTLDVSVAFAPLVAGTWSVPGGNSGTISISTDAVQAAEYRIDLVGTSRRAPACVIGVNPAAVNFGQVGEGRSSTQRVIVRNVGELDCTFTSAAVRAPEGSFSGALVDLTPGDVLGPQQYGFVEVTFAPTAVNGAENGTLDVVTSDPTRSTIEVPLQASSVVVPPCFLEPQPTAINFGNQPLYRSVEREVVLTNVGTETCVVTDVNLTAGAESFRVVEPPLTQLGDQIPPILAPFFPIGAFVPEGESVSFIVAYRPGAAGPQLGNVQFTYKELRFGASNQLADVALSGVGTPPCIRVTPLDRDFGDVAVGSQATADFAVSNCGAADLFVRGLNLRAGSHPDFSIPTPPFMPAALAPGAAVTVTVRAAPTQLGTQQAGAAMYGFLDVLSDVAPVTASLRANAPEACQQELQCSPSSIVFGELNVGDSMVKSLVCQNPGNQPASLSPSVGAPFEIVSAPASIGPGQSGVVQVRYTANTANASTGTVNLGGTSCAGAPVTVSVRGTGVDDALPPCPQPTVFSPQTVWEWGENVATEPRSVQTWTTPLVSRLEDTTGDNVVTRDDMPRVVFISFNQDDAPSYLATGGITGSAEQVNDPVPGILRAIDGATAREVWTTRADRSVMLNSSVTPALVDLDGDGCVEIIGSKYILLPGVEALPNGPKVHGKFARGFLMAFDCRGRVKWESMEWTRNTDELEDAGGVAVGDIDGDGFAEIAFGNHVYDHNGNLLWVGSKGTGSSGHGPQSFFADVDGQPGLELVAGPTVYRSNGQVLWDKLSTVSWDGLAVVGDLDGDGDNEVVFRGRELVVFDKLGNVLAGPRIPPTRAGMPANQDCVSPTGGTGGDDERSDPCDVIANNPTLLDVNGDGSLEIVVASQELLIVYDRDLNELWRAPIQDTTGASGPAGFDFEADGTDNVVYSDENKVRSWSRTGSVVYEAGRSSVTLMEYTPIADIDNDSHANLLAGSNEPQFDLADGLDAFQNTGVRWAQARGIWNQHAYIEGLVSELGAPIPNTSSMPLPGFRWASAQCVP